MKHLPALLVLFAAIIGCADNSNRPANTISRANTSNAPLLSTPTPKPVYDNDLTGQALRIKDEGVDDFQIKQNLLNADKSITYELLKKNPQKYAGRPWAFEGKILEITEKNGATVARITLDDWGNKPMMVMGPIETSFVEKDHVYVVGYLAGDYSYTSQANWNITIPALAVRAIMKKKDAAKYQK